MIQTTCRQMATLFVGAYGLATIVMGCLPSRAVPIAVPLAVPETAPRDTADPVLEVELAALRAMLATHKGQVVLGVEQPGFNAVHSRRNGTVRPKDRSERLARSIGATVEVREAVLECPDGWSTCSLGNVASFVELSQPHIVADSATIQLTRWYRAASQRQPVVRETMELWLRRENGAWSVTGWKQVSIT